MSISTVASIRSETSWNSVQTTNTVRINDIGGLYYTATLTNGTGLGEADAVYYKTGALASGGSETFDLTNLSRTVLNGQLIYNFRSIKQFSVTNLADATGVPSVITVSPYGGNAWLGFFGGATGIPIDSEGCLSMANNRLGWAVSAGSRNFAIYDENGQGATYELAIIGVTGTG